MKDFFIIFTYIINIGIILILGGLLVFLYKKTKDKENWYIGRSLTYLRASLVIVIILDVVMMILGINFQFLAIFPIIITLNGFIDMMGIKVGSKGLLGIFTGCKFEEIENIILKNYGKSLFIRINLINGKYKMLKIKYNKELVKELKMKKLKIREV